MIKAMIFDMDGVIIDSEPLHYKSDKMTMDDYNISITDKEFSSFAGVSNSEMWSIIRSRFNLSCTVTELLETQTKYKLSLFNNKELVPITGIIKLLDYLKDKKIRIALASSSSREFIEMILNNLKIYKYFEVIVSGDDVEYSKPSPDIFLMTLKELNLKDYECVVLEDSENGVKAAKKANLKCIGFKNPNSGEQNLGLADIMVNSINEIIISELVIN